MLQFFSNKNSSFSKKFFIQAPKIYLNSWKCVANAGSLGQLGSVPRPLLKPNVKHTRTHQKVWSMCYQVPPEELDARDLSLARARSSDIIIFALFHPPQIFSHFVCTSVCVQHESTAHSWGVTRLTHLRQETGKALDIL